MIVFERPEDSFAEGAEPNPDFIHVFTSEDEIIAGYNTVFELLDQYQVSRKAEELPPGAIRGAVDPERVVSLMHGLRLRYTLSETVGHLVPTISVMPVIFLRSDSGSWFKIAHRVVDTEAIRFFLFRYDDLEEHLTAVRADSERLLERVRHWLGRPLQPTPVCRPVVVSK